MIADSLASVEANYYVLQISLDEFSRFARRHLEVSAKVNGVASEMTKFDFLLVACLEVGYLGWLITYVVLYKSRSCQQQDRSKQMQ